MKGVTLEESSAPQIKAPEQTVFFDGFIGIIRARGEKSTMLSEKRRNGLFVNADQEKNNVFHKACWFGTIAVNERRYSFSMDCREAPWISFLTMKTMSRGFGIKSLCVRNRALKRRLIVFLSTAPPTFFLTTTAILEKSKSLER
jgi:hypothetical protein